jgi:hypothetical protein
MNDLIFEKAFCPLCKVVRGTDFPSIHKTFLFTVTGEINNIILVEVFLLSSPFA